MYITPCIGICKVNNVSRTCEGCGRTPEEISDWNKYSDEQRMEVMRRLGYGVRRARHNTYEERMRRYDRG